MSPTASSDTHSDWLIDDDGQPAEAKPAAVAEPWRVLIVDDDVDVHVVTKFSLSNASFLGRRLCFLHAYSGAEAVAMLRATPDIALVLLDVIMETNDAGLRAVRQIRDDLGNRLVRIVLRTGQPGQALEHSIILDYDINDFWCKTDLTTRKLFTTVIASLRTYASLQAADHNISALHSALEHNRPVDGMLDLHVNTALDQHALRMLLDHDGRVADLNSPFCTLLQRRREDVVGRPAPWPIAQSEAMRRQLGAGQAWSGELAAQATDGSEHALRATVLPLNAGRDKPPQYLLIATAAAPQLDVHPVI